MHFLYSIQISPCTEVWRTQQPCPPRFGGRAESALTEGLVLFYRKRAALCEHHRHQIAAPGAGCKFLAVKHLSPPPEAREAVSKLARCSVTCSSPLTREESRTLAKATLHWWRKTSGQQRKRLCYAITSSFFLKAHRNHSKTSSHLNEEAFPTVTCFPCGLVSSHTANLCPQQVANPDPGCTAPAERAAHHPPLLAPLVGSVFSLKTPKFFTAELEWGTVV